MNSRMRNAILTLVIAAAAWAMLPVSADAPRGAVAADRLRKHAPPARARAADSAPRLMNPVTANADTGLTFMEYLTSSPRRPAPESRTIYLLPADAGIDPDQLRDMGVFLSAYYQLPVRSFREAPIPAAIPARGRGQLDADAIMNHFERQMPGRVFLCLIVTSRDIYSDGLPYVFGLAYADMKCAIVSTTRIWQDPGRAVTQAERMRFWKLSAHELGHGLGLPHCADSRCVMNAQASLMALDQSPATLCPGCMRKESWNIGYEPESWCALIARTVTDLGQPALAADFDAQRKTLAGIRQVSSRSLARSTLFDE